MSNGILKYFTTSAINLNAQNPANVVTGQLNLQGVSFNDPLRGAGQLQATVAIKSADQASRVQQLTNPDQSCIYVVWYPDSDVNDGAVVLWGGPITGRDWNHRTRNVTLTVGQWESWFSTRLLTPNVLTNVQQDAAFKFTTVDQFSIARSLIGLALGSNTGQGYPGMPVMLFDKATQLSGTTRTVSWPSTNFATYVDTINELTQQQGGFDWPIGYVQQIGNDGRDYIVPTIYFYYPERQPLNSYNMKLNSELRPDGTSFGNILDYDLPEDVSNRLSRVFEIGNGTSGDSVFRNVLATNNTQYLYREGSETHQDVTTAAALDQFGRLTAQQLSFGTSQVTCAVKPDAPDLGTYFVGDRTEFKISDWWHTVDVKAARITNRAISAPTPLQYSVTLTLDVTDSFGPSVEA